MSNLGVNCDKKSCHLCTTCIYDDFEILKEEENKIKKTMETSTETKNKRLFCNGCTNFEQIPVSTRGGNYNNCYCNYRTPKKLLDVSVPESHNFSAPNWCPFNNGEKTDENYRKKNIHDLSPTVVFNEIKVGDLYRIPPYNGIKGKHIEITYKTEYSATYKILNPSCKQTTVSTLFPNTPQMKIITPYKLTKPILLKKCEE